jgi:hypothetical protein
MRLGKTSVKGRIYRYGQDKVVQVYHFFNKGTIEDKVQSYFEDRLDRAAVALAKVTGETPEEVKGTLNGQLARAGGNDFISTILVNRLSHRHLQELP